MELEQTLKMLTVAVLLGYALGVSTVFEVSYPEQLVNLYIYPWWRILLVIVVAAGWYWSPLVGVLLALVVFFYFHDMDMILSAKLAKDKN